MNIIDGQVLGGRAGLHKTLNRFVIGAMKLEAMMRYTGPDNLLIVGNRTKAHELALQAGAGVLITGGFQADDHVTKLADELELPVITTTYDTFTVATMINRAIYDQLIKKEIVLVGDIFTPFDQTVSLTIGDKVSHWIDKNRLTLHSRFPVLDRHLKVQGIVTAKDIMGAEQETPIEKVMTKQPITVTMKTSVAAAAHMMIWEGIELLPVVDDQSRIQGIVSRQDVLKTLQMAQRQPQMGETLDDTITNQIDLSGDKSEETYTFEVTPQMTNQLGAISYGVFTTIVTEAARRSLRAKKKGDIVVENITIYFSKPVQMESLLEIHPNVLEVGRKFGKVDVEVYNGGMLVGKALMMCQILDRQ